MLVSRDARSRRSGAAAGAWAGPLGPAKSRAIWARPSGVQTPVMYERASRRDRPGRTERHADGLEAVGIQHADVNGVRHRDGRQPDPRAGSAGTASGRIVQRGQVIRSAARMAAASCTCCQTSSTSRLAYVLIQTYVLYTGSYEQGQCAGFGQVGTMWLRACMSTRGRFKNDAPSVTATPGRSTSSATDRRYFRRASGHRIRQCRNRAD